MPFQVICAAFFLFPLLLTAQPRPSLVIVTDAGWDVGATTTHFGEYPLSAEQAAAASADLRRGPHKAVAAEYNRNAKIVPGSVPIWRNRKSTSEGEAYYFHRAVPLGPDPVRKATLEINADDVARVYINQRLATAEKRDGTLKDGYDVWFNFRSVSGFTYSRLYTYDVTDYFFTHVTNTVLVEAVSLAFDGSHANFSAKIVIEFDPLPPPVKAKPAAAKAKPRPPAAPATTPATAADKVIFEAGSDPEYATLRPGSVLELGHVFFKADQFQLDSASYLTLSALAGFMQRYPGLKIEVGGHTNLRPNEHFAAELSANRAMAVRRYLLDKGISADRVTHRGYGKTQPRIRALSKEADRANQRVEIKVLEK
ncbi:MAG: OmpA family protein [Saprospiraceae bacterium]|nr:OmpA family protein [Saprospiraceae bacterium]